MTLAERIAELEGEGWVVVQAGRIIAPPGPGVDFEQRAEGCNGRRVAPSDKLIDDEERWAHLRLDTALPRV